jgi:hypothetical protein
VRQGGRPGTEREESGGRHLLTGRCRQPMPSPAARQGAREEGDGGDLDREATAAGFLGSRSGGDSEWAMGRERSLVNNAPNTTRPSHPYKWRTTM